MTGIILDSVVMVLLLITIGYAMRLSAKLNIIKNQKLDFAANIKAFHEATEAAIVAVENLHVKGENVCKLIDEKIKAAGLINDEIEFISERARKQLIGLKALDIKQAPAPIAHRAAVNSLAEAQLMKALREREYREALNG